MIKAKIVAISIGALAASGVVDVGEHVLIKPDTLPIPYRSVGEAVPMQKYPYSPVIECSSIVTVDNIDIDIINQCAVNRVGWFKL